MKTDMRKHILLVFMLSLCLAYMIIIRKGRPEKNIEINPLDGCTYVYLDMGSNRGIQIRYRNFHCFINDITMQF